MKTDNGFPKLKTTKLQRGTFGGILNICRQFNCILDLIHEDIKPPTKLNKKAEASLRDIEKQEKLVYCESLFFGKVLTKKSKEWISSIIEFCLYTVLSVDRFHFLIRSIIDTMLCLYFNLCHLFFIDPLCESN